MAQQRIEAQNIPSIQSGGYSSLRHRAGVVTLAILVMIILGMLVVAFAVPLSGFPDGLWSGSGRGSTADTTPATRGTPSLPAAGPAPILIVRSSASTFGNFYGEILRAEGLNAFDVADLSAVDGDVLRHYDVVLLARSDLTSAQAAMFSDWVAGGGNLIAMAPDPQLAELLGLTPGGGSLTDGYLRVDTSAGPGKGIVGDTIQFHGPANRYWLNGARSLATLYETATDSTDNPAVTLRQVGSKGGQAAAFAYDLATSIVLTRQGNPAWAAQERDGSPPIRPNDKFFGAASGDPQKDWIDLAKVAIPQADEQQRLFANLILQMNLDRKPLPRFWYFPHGKRAVVILTGDDHGRQGPGKRFNELLLRSPAGCSVANWECIRATSYTFPSTPLSNQEAAGYAALGFEFSPHISTGCERDYTADSLNAFYRDQIRDWRRQYSSLPAPVTERHHCIVWSDWASGARVELAHGVRLDLNYYFWPSKWVGNAPGLFTGSAMPMRFADLDGTLIDVYGAATQMTDESGQAYPFTVDALLDRALGPEGYFGAYTVNAHTDEAESEVADTVVASALKRGVPIVSARQMLTWLDGRNNSRFKGLAWQDNALAFTVSPGAGAHGLQALLPLQQNSGVLGRITMDGQPVAFEVVTIKGMEYGAFPAKAGRYVASYGPAPAGTPASSS